jgi:molecular chaperone GrpE
MRPGDEDETTPEHTFRVEVDDAVLNEALNAVERSARSEGGDKKLEDKIAELEARLKSASDEAAQMKDKYLRSVADFDNFRKRALRDKEEARQYGAENLLRDLLVVLDNMERAVGAAGDLESIKQGVKMTHDQFKQILKQHGVEIIESAGAPFDPSHHEAVAHVETAAHSPGVVIEEHRRGYKFRERLLRPAMVSVAKALPGESSGSQGDS